MGRERRPAPVVAVGDGRPGAGPEEPELRRSCKGGRPLGAYGLGGRRAREIRSDVARTARPSAAARQGETDATGDATLALCFAGAVVGMAVYSAKALLHGKGGDAWEMMAENIP